MKPLYEKKILELSLQTRPNKTTLPGGILESILSTSAQRDGIPTLDDLIADMYVTSSSYLVISTNFTSNLINPAHSSFLSTLIAHDHIFLLLLQLLFVILQNYGVYDHFSIFLVITNIPDDVSC